MRGILAVLPVPRPAYGMLVLAATVGLLLVASTVHSQEHDRFGFVGFDVGPGRAAIEDDRKSGGEGVVFLGMEWTGPWGFGVAAHFWWHRQDTLRTELTVVGPTLMWRPLKTGPLVRVTPGVAYQHQILDFAASSEDRRTDGLGVGTSIAYEWRVAPVFALGPQIDFAWLWLDDEVSASFWGGSLELTLYFPLAKLSSD